MGTEGSVERVRYIHGSWLESNDALLNSEELEELSVSICAEATSKFFALNEAVFGLKGRF